jgi:hypothetical protein
MKGTVRSTIRLLNLFIYFILIKAEFLNEWQDIGVDLNHLHFAFLGVKLNRNLQLAHVIPCFHHMSGHELLEFLDRQSHPWDTTFDGKDISQIMKVVYRCKCLIAQKLSLVF